MKRFQQGSFIKSGFKVVDFPRFDYSMRQVERAGKVIAGKLDWNPDTEAQIREAFRIANNWRDAHAYPMRSIRHQLGWYINSLKLNGISVARLKRMQAIRRKLSRVPENLNQLQDLGGCRVILGSISDVHSLVENVMSKTRHSLWNQDNYIAQPKKDGYRSHHLIFKFNGRGESTVHSGRRIEVQVRTRLQHSWATAVEAVGLFRGEDLKGNVGDSDWLRLFRLMSAEFSWVENCEEPPDVPARAERIREIIHLERKLEASATLSNLTYAVRYTEEAVQPPTEPQYYLIKFDNQRKEVDITPMFRPKSAVESYDSAEEDNSRSDGSKNIVLIEADKIENLKEAYPNYFGDVQLFKHQLVRVVSGKDPEEYIVRPQEKVPVKPRENPDLSWLKRRHRRWS